ncbi:hypothetical protein EV359DRAFT_35492, partial [Lentinula novae-zelandiae]
QVKHLRAQLYPANSVHPKAIVARFRENPEQPTKDCFIFAGNLLLGPRFQPYIHDIALTIHYRGKFFKFLVFFKRHKLLPPDQCIQNLQGGHIDGNLLLVSCGKKVLIRNLRNRLEVRAADRAIKRLAEALNPIRTWRQFPSTLSFD